MLWNYFIKIDRKDISVIFKKKNKKKPAFYNFYLMYAIILLQSVPMTTDVVSSNLDQGEVYNIMC